MLSAFVQELFHEELQPILPLFVIGIAASLFVLCVRILRKVTWGS